jgi:hypothetical protein
MQKILTQRRKGFAIQWVVGTVHLLVLGAVMPGPDTMSGFTWRLCAFALILDCVDWAKGGSTKGECQDASGSAGHRNPRLFFPYFSPATYSPQSLEWSYPVNNSSGQNP